ncbi:MAG: hypothetical protein ACI3XG_10665 [Faecousia sp.]
MKQPKQQKPRNKGLFLFLLALGCAALLATGTYAAYTTSATVKRVVAARTHEANDQLRFSSNYLSKYDLGEYDYVIRPISVSSSGDVITIGITVCNYPQNDPSSYNDKTITYSMSVTPPFDTTVNLDYNTGTLPGGQISSNLHQLTISSDDLSSVSSGFITVVVTPDDPSAVGNNKLAANLKVMPTAAEASPWNYELIFNGPSEENDAINLHIYGTKECDMVLSWGDKVELGRWSKKLLGVDENATSPLTIHVGGSGQPTSYYLQFYRTQPAEAGETSNSLRISFEPKS